MPSTRLLQALLARLARAALVGDQVWAAAARPLLALGLLVAIGTGEWLAWGAGLAGYPDYGTVRWAHALGGTLVALVGLYRLACHVAAMAWPPGRPVRPPARVLAAAARQPGYALAVTGFWAGVALLALSGAQRVVLDRTGADLLPVLSAGAWVAVHRVAVPYCYGFLTLALLWRLRRAYPALLDYVFRHY